jgi:UV DNA damage endonuclease
MKRKRSMRESEDDEMYEELKITKKAPKNAKNKSKNASGKKFQKTDQETPKKSSNKKSKKGTDKKSNRKSKSTSKVDLRKLDVDDSDEEDCSLVENRIAINLGTLSFNSSNIGPIRVRLGLPCINNYLKNLKETVFCSRGITLATYRSKGKQEAKDKAAKNVLDIEKLIRWNKAHYIDCLRLSSDLFPHYSNIKNISEKDRYNLNFVKEDLEKAGEVAKKHGQRITMHPGQFNVVGSPHESVFESTCVDLKMHADILDYMKMDNNSILVVHGGGTYGDKKTTIKRWITNFKRLPENVQNRLVLENCEKNFSIIDCLEINKELGIPIVFDNHHFECYKKYHPDEEFDDIRTYIKPSLESWLRKGLRPKFHISEQAPDKVVGAHSDYIKVFPEYYLEIPELYKIGVDIMIEAKAKEAAIFDLYKRYKEHFLGHLDDFDETRLEFDREKQMAKKCPSCDL